MPRAGKFFKVFFPLALTSIAIFLCFKNYTPETFLLGWDSLHPEFNFSEAFKRTFWGAWREEQGVGQLRPFPYGRLAENFYPLAFFPLFCP